MPAEPSMPLINAWLVRVDEVDWCIGVPHQAASAWHHDQLTRGRVQLEGRVDPPELEQALVLLSYSSIGVLLQSLPASA